MWADLRQKWTDIWLSKSKDVLNRHGNLPNFYRWAFMYRHWKNWDSDWAGQRKTWIVKKWTGTYMKIWSMLPEGQKWVGSGQMWTALDRQHEKMDRNGQWNLSNVARWSYMGGQNQKMDRGEHDLLARCTPSADIIFESWWLLSMLRFSV